MWRRLRIGILLVVLLVVALNAVGDRRRTTDWNDTLWIGVFPVNADGRPATDQYIAGLTHERFVDVEAFFRREASAWGVGLDSPVHVELFPQVAALPPRLARDAGVPATIWWSLQTRYYTWRHAGGTLADIRVFMLYHDPAWTETVPHSLGLQKGLVGIVHAFADDTADATNNVVLAHEVMHALGATDKYDPATDLPRYPEGYGDPAAAPLYPQTLAEIMAGRVAISADEAVMPSSLADVVVGPQTAAEINWTGD